MFVEICEAVYERYLDFSISTDVIVGFPGETEEDFEKTLNVLKHIRPTVVNRSRYSARPHTPASERRQLHSRVIAERSQRLARLVETLSLENNQRWLGRSDRVLIDDRRKKDSVLSRSEYYKPVVIPLTGRTEQEVSRLSPGFFCDVKFVEATTYHLVGEPEKKGNNT
jgi:tRNA A37 methylthiotransferase MiaB